MVAFQACCVRIKASPNHNARRDDANAQNASHMDTSILLLRREVGEGTAMIANDSYYQTKRWALKCFSAIVLLYTFSSPMSD